MSKAGLTNYPRAIIQLINKNFDETVIKADNGNTNWWNKDGKDAKANEAEAVKSDHETEDENIS